MKTMPRYALYRLSVILTLSLAIVLIYFPPSMAAGTISGQCEEGLLCAIYFDVGQGDAVYIESPSGTQVLIDGGRGGKVLQRLSDEIGFFDRSLDLVIATHPDADHIGGLIDVLERYDVAMIMRTDNQSDALVAQTFAELVEGEGAEFLSARRGQEIDIGGGAVLEILFPNRSAEHMDSNASSIVLELRYGDTEFLFTGDAPKNVEEYLVTVDGEYLKADVLKVGHHGSKTSSAAAFLEAVSPVYGIISAGANNPYGHPHQEVLDRLDEYGVETKSTADGNVTVLSDGEGIEVR